jgi:hypothetical protein
MFDLFSPNFEMENNEPVYERSHLRAYIYNILHVLILVKNTVHFMTQAHFYW